MKKIKFNESFVIPEKYNNNYKIEKLGSYTIASNKNELVIIGGKVFDILDSEIDNSAILPVTKEFFDKMENEFDEPQTFHYYEDVVYYRVSNNGYFWVFDNLNDALSLVVLFVSVKVATL